MPIRNVPSLLSLSLLAGVFAVQFIEEVPAPDLEQDRGEAWAVAGPPYPDLHVGSSAGWAARKQTGGDIGRGGWRRRREKTSPDIVSTLQQQITRDSRKFSPSEFLPGIGPFQSSLLNKRPERTALKELFSLDLPDESVDPGFEEVEQISPVVVTLSDSSPLAALKLDTYLEEEEDVTACRYEQFSEEQASLSTTSNCTKGGMRCERKCSQRTEEPVCTQTLVDICEDVPERVCQTVTEKHCRTVQEEVCDGTDGYRAEK